MDYYLNNFNNFTAFNSYFKTLISFVLQINGVTNINIDILNRPMAVVALEALSKQFNVHIRLNNVFGTKIEIDSISHDKN